MVAKRRRSRRPAATSTTTNTTTNAADADANGDFQRAQINATNNAKLRANALSIHDDIQATRPKNTKRTYGPKQKEYQVRKFYLLAYVPKVIYANNVAKAFCKEKQFQDGDTVTEDKLLLFLKTCVVDRPLRTRSKDVDESIPQEETKLAWRSVRSYVTAITDLYHTQLSLGMNTHPSPRKANTRQYIKSLQRLEVQRKRDQLADKGRDTLLDGYNFPQFEKACEMLWEKSDTSPECHFRTLVDFLLSHYMLERGVNRRNAELSDVHTFEFPNEGPTPCKPLIFTSREGKENKFGRLQTIGALRHRKPVVCLLSALAFYLLLRWDLTDEPLPDFGHRAAWYGVRLLVGSSYGRSRGGGGTTEPLGYSTQLDWINKVLEYAGIDSRKKTHIGRGAAAKLAELLGVSEDQIRRQGWWDQDEMRGCYLTSLPREFMRAMAGHPRFIGCFEIPRAGVAPPDELLSMIWPDLDQWKGRFGPELGQIQDLAAMGFTDLLFSLREVILQDSVFLRKRFPRSPVWEHPVFQHPAYAEFAARMEGAVEVGVEDNEQRPTKLTMLTHAMPELAEGLHGVRGDVKELRSETRSNFKTMAEQVQAQSVRTARIEHLLTSGSLALRMPQDTPAAGAGHTPSLAAGRTAAFNLPEPLWIQRLRQQALQQEQQQAPQEPQEPWEPQEGEEPPRYTMCRTVTSVQRLWQEWTVGLNGDPSISALNSRWGSRWRSGRQSELQWYSLRHEVIREIQRRAKVERSSEEQVMWSLNLQQHQMGCSLDRFCKQLRAGRKSSEALARRSTRTGTGKGTAAAASAASAVEGMA
jgi:hypothetical protein